MSRAGKVAKALGKRERSFAVPYRRGKAAGNTRRAPDAPRSSQTPGRRKAIEPVTFSAASLIKKEIAEEGKRGALIYVKNRPGGSALQTVAAITALEDSIR